MATILCIEDEAEIREFIVEELEASGYEMLEAGNGRQALDTLKERTPDLILCDINMPVMNGYDLLDEVRARHPELTHTPFIFLSAFNERDHVIEGKSRGADDYLTKPIDYELLHATVEARLAQIERIRGDRDRAMVRLYKHLASGTAANPAPPAGTQTAPPADPNDAAFREKIHAARDPETGEVTVGRFQMIGLDSVRKELGPRWEKLADIVGKFAQSTIVAHLGEGDSFSRNDSGEFVVCFARLGQEEAWHKAKEIEEEILQRIVGDAEIGTLARSGAAPVDPSRIADMDSDIRRIQVDPEEIDDTPDLSDLITAKLQAAGQKVKAKLKQVVLEANASCKTVLRAVLTRTGAHAPMQIEDFDDITHTKLEEARNLANGAQDIAAEIDILAMGKAAEYILDNADTDLKPIMVEISYSTLIDRQSLAKICKMCGQLGDFATNYLIPVVKDIPTGVAAGRLDAALAGIRKCSKYQSLYIEESNFRDFDPAGSRFPVVILKYQFIQASAERNAEAVTAFMETLRARKVRVLIDGVPKHEFMEFLNQHPVDLVALDG